MSYLGVSWSNFCVTRNTNAVQQLKNEDLQRARKAPGQTKLTFAKKIKIHSFMTEVPIIYKLVYWFADQIIGYWFLYEGNLCHERANVIYFTLSQFMYFSNNIKLPVLVLNIWLNYNTIGRDWCRTFTTTS